MTYYEQYKKMFPTVEAFAAVVEKTPPDEWEDDISPRPSMPLFVLMAERDKAIKVALTKRGNTAKRNTRSGKPSIVSRRTRKIPA
jgi:hypothetical protein